MKKKYHCQKYFKKLEFETNLVTILVKYRISAQASGGALFSWWVCGGVYTVQVVKPSSSEPAKVKKG